MTSIKLRHIRSVRHLGITTLVVLLMLALMVSGRVQYDVVDVLAHDGSVRTAVAVEGVADVGPGIPLTCPGSQPVFLSTSPTPNLLALFPNCAHTTCAVAWAPVRDVQACNLPADAAAVSRTFPAAAESATPTASTSSSSPYSDGIAGLEGLEWVMETLPANAHRNMSMFSSMMGQVDAHSDDDADDEEETPTNDSSTIRRHTNHPSVHRHFQKFANMFLETQTKIEGLLRAGVRAKEVFALIVDQIMNMAPEIILQILISVLRGVFVELMGKVLSVLLPPLLIPNSGASPPTLPGLPVPRPKPAVPCKCRNKLGETYTPKYSMLEQWTRAVHAGTGAQTTTAATTTTTTTTTTTATSASESRRRNEAELQRLLCPCQPGHTVVLLETGADAEATTTGPPLESKKDVLERVEEKSGDAIKEGLEAEALPATYDRVLTRLSKSLTTVTPQTVVRGVNRALTSSLAHSLTSSISRSLLAGLSRKVLKDCTRSVSAKLIPALTVSLSSTLAQTMSRDPRSDYFCDYCNRFKTYCDECHVATVASHHLDVTVAKYARHFGGHYAKLYSGELADDISGLVLGEG